MFYIPILLITTFLAFIVVPDLIYLSVAIIQQKPSDTLDAACWISYAVSNLVDAYIYIYLQHDVRIAVKKTFKGRDKPVVRMMLEPSRYDFLNVGNTSTPEQYKMSTV